MAGIPEADVLTLIETAIDDPALYVTPGSRERPTSLRGRAVLAVLAENGLAITREPDPGRHPRVTFINAVNGEGGARCYPDEAAAFEDAATYQPFNNTRIRLGWCEEKHAQQEH